MGKTANSPRPEANVIPIGRSVEEDASETVPEDVPVERRAAVGGHPARTSRPTT